MDIKKLVKVDIEYCPTCSLPFEYCEYSKKHNAKPTAEVQEQKEVQTQDEQPEKVAPVKKEKVKIKILLHEKKNRSLTTVSGFEKIKDLKIKDLVKKLTKQLGCGSGNITPDSFELQGLYKFALINFLVEKTELNLTEDNFVIEDKVKNEAKKKNIN